MSTVELDIVNSALIKVGELKLTQTEYDNGSNKKARIAAEQFPKIRDMVFRLHTWHCISRRAKLVNPVFTIAGATQDDKVIERAPAHTFITGDFVEVDDIVGMTELNGNDYLAKTPNPGEIQLYDEDGDSIDGSAYTAYASGGTATLVPAFGFDYAYDLPDGCLRVVKVTDSDDSGDYDFVVEGDNILTNRDPAYIKYLYQETDPDNWDAVLREMVATHLAIDLAYNLTNSRTLADYIRRTYVLDDLPEARTTDAQEGRPDVVDGSSWIDER